MHLSCLAPNRRGFESAARSLRGSDARIIQEYPLGTPNACVADLEPVLRALRSVAAPGARLHVSFPNARHFSLLVDLLFRGTFGYRVFGHRDATHLRWYTRRDIVALVGRTGWDVQWAIADVPRPQPLRRPPHAAAGARVPRPPVARPGARRIGALNPGGRRVAGSACGSRPGRPWRAAPRRRAGREGRARTAA